MALQFASYNVKPELAAFLASLGFKDLSPVQEKGLPALLKGKSAVVKAPTGSGKTLTYIVPILNDLDQTSYTEAVIIVPTSMLVGQLGDVLHPFQTGYKDFSVGLIADGASQKVAEFKQKIIVATPTQFLFNRDKMNLKQVKRLIIDEGDMIMFGGYQEDLDQILEMKIGKATDLFTASIDEQLNTMVKKYIGANTLIDASAPGITSSNVTHYLVDIRHQDPIKSLETFLKLKKPFKTIVFVSRKIDLEIIHKQLLADNVPHILISGELEPHEQKKAYREFGLDDAKLLLASDIASRGIDVKDVSTIISMDLPYDLTYYFHRAGRTGRFDKKGESYVFYNNDDTKKAKELVSRGVDFHFLSLHDSLIKAEKFISEKDRRPKLNNVYLETAIRAKIRKLRTKEIRPCYKKKIRSAIALTKKMHKEDIIRSNISHRNAEEGTNIVYVNDKGQKYAERKTFARKKK